MAPRHSAVGQTSWPSAPKWSAIAPRADIERVLPFAPVDLMRVWQPRLPLGIFSLTSNPAALAWEAAPTHSDYAVEQHGQRGDYRRPLDAAQSSEILLGASGATRMGANGGVLGGITEENDRLSPGARVDQSQPFGSSPLVLADTTASPMSATAVDIVGAGGWSLGPFAAGISGAYDTQSLHTDRAGFVRQTQITTPGLTLGVAVRAGTPLHLVLGAHTGTQRQSQTTNFLELTEQGLLYQLQGFRDASLIQVKQSYYQRFDERTNFVGGALAGDVIGARWLLGIEGATRHDLTTHAEASAALMDRWRTNGTTVTAGVERTIESATIRAVVRSTAVSGALQMSSDSLGPSLTSRERASFGQLEVLTPIGARTALLVSAAVLDERLTRADTLEGVLLDLNWRDPVVGATVSYRLSSRVAVLLGLAGGWHNAAGHIPRATDRDVAYRTFIAPEIAIYASPATATSAQLGFACQLTGTLRATLTGQRASVGPTGFAYISERPSGSREMTSIRFSMSFSPGQ
jgi:hypothetical protein